MNLPSETDATPPKALNATKTSPQTESKALKKADDEIVPLHGFVYSLMSWLFLQWFRVGGLKVYGRENVPKSGAVIIAPNHQSLFDPPLVGSVSPRRVTTMGKAELFDKKWFGLKIFPWIIQRMATFPVKRGAPDRRAIRRAITTLKNSEVLVIFPEGTRTRSGELGEGEIGLAMIAHQTKAPIVPMYHEGTQNALSPLRGGIRLFKTRVYYGEPLYFENEYSNKATREVLESIVARVMSEIQKLKDEAKPRSIS